MRLGAFRIFILIAFVFVGLGLFWNQVMRGARFRFLSERNSIRLIPEDPYRGRIYDRAGRLMVDNALSFDVVVTPQELREKTRVLEGAARILGLEGDEVARRYKRGYLNPFTPVVIAGGVSKEVAIGVQEQALDFGGLSVRLASRRFYPHGILASHVLGYIGEIDRSRMTRLKSYGYDLKDKVGYSGVEERLDASLRGEKGGEQIEVDSVGRQVRVLGYRPSRFGMDVQLALNLELQQVADHALEGRKGAVVVMDVTTGEVWVLSSAPAFDPNVFVDRKDKTALNYYLTSEDAPLINRAISGQFPPGSVFKPVTAAAALKAKEFPASMSYLCRGQMKIGERTFKCWTTHGTQDLYRAMGHSCDVYFYHMGYWGGVDNMTRMSHEFGLGKATGIDLSHEKAGFVPSRLWKNLVKFEGWYDGDTANFSIGQGFLLTTPLQLTVMMAAIANGGGLVTPRVTLRVGENVIPAAAPRAVKVPAKHLALLRELLRQPVVLESGTAHTLDIPGLEVCAKTGTAQVTGKESHGWVAGFFPLKNPRFAFCVLVENAGSSSVACSVMRELLLVGRDRGQWT